MSAVRLSLYLGAQLAPEAPADRQVDELFEQILLAETLGFDTVFLPHHHLAGVPYLQPIPLLGALAARTRRIRLGTAVLLLPLRHPVALAEELATLDVLSGGRITLGVGQGYRGEEFEAFGVPPGERGAWLEVSVDVMRRLWAGEHVSVHGAFGRLENAALALPPVQPGGPPVWIGAASERGIRRAAWLGDAWIGSSGLRAADLGPALALFRRERAAAGRPTPTQPLLREACVAATREAAHERLRRHLGAKLASYAQWGLARPGVEETIAECAVAGTAADAAVQIGDYHRRFGVDHLILRVQWPGLPQAEALETLRRLGEDVRGRLA